MPGMSRAVQEADRQRFDALFAHIGEQPANRTRVRGLEHDAIGGDALVDFDHRRIERRRLADRQFKQPRPVLIADRQHVAEAARRDQGRSRSAPRDQGIRAAGRAQADGHRRNRVSHAQSQQPANRQHGSLIAGNEFIGLPGSRLDGQVTVESKNRRRRLKRSNGRFRDCDPVIIEQAKPKVFPKAYRRICPCGIDNSIGGRARADDPFRDAGTQQLVPRQAPIRPPRDAVRESPANVNPELPAVVHAVESTAHLPPTDMRCDTVRTYIRPPAIAGVVRQSSWSGFLASSWY